MPYLPLIPDIRDKHGVLEDMSGRRLDLGCGPRPPRPGHVGVDLLDYPTVDVVGDVFDVLGRIPDGAVAAVHSAHFLEHVSDVPALLEELARTIRPGGTLDAVVPHFSNPYYYSDLTHRSQFGLYTLSYLAEDPLHRRTVPSYERAPSFRIRSVRLRFKSPRPFYGRYAAKRVVEGVVNSSRWTREFYEENLTWLLPCYEIHFALERLQPVAG